MCFLYLQRNVNFCSDFANVASEMPYFWPSSSMNRDQLHFVICVHHGLDGKIFHMSISVMVMKVLGLYLMVCREIGPSSL